MDYNKTFITFNSSFKTITDKHEIFLSSDSNLTNKIKSELKELYEFSKNEEIKNIKSNALPNLIVENFDIEQIWQQIELQNDSLLTRSLENVSKLIVNKNKLLFKNFDKLQSDGDEHKDEDEMEVDYSNDEDNNEEESLNELSDENSSLSDEDVSNENNNSNKNKKFKSSEVDDEFFKLDEMENYLTQEEKKLNEPDSGNDSEDSETEENVDLFEAQPDEVGEDNDDDENAAETAKYKDFFVENEVIRKKPKRNKLFEEFDEENDNDKNNKSKFEMRQSQLSKKINEMEEKAIREKPWQLQGEITAEKRPENSLLDEIVEFDISAKPAPVMTEKTTLQLEDIILKRIKDKVFDSVIRKLKPTDISLQYKKTLVLNQEKSKESLAEIYEKDYLKQKVALDPENTNKEEEPQSHKDVNSKMNSLFRQLDALSNFHFTTKPAVPELKIINNMPAINMEEVAPIAVSEGALLAPEEVKGKPKGDVLDKNERTVTDKKRERRKKKNQQKEKAKKKQQNEKIIKKL